MPPRERPERSERPNLTDDKAWQLFRPEKVTLALTTVVGLVVVVWTAAYAHLSLITRLERIERWQQTHTWTRGQMREWAHEMRQTKEPPDPDAIARRIDD